MNCFRPPITNIENDCSSRLYRVSTWNWVS